MTFAEKLRELIKQPHGDEKVQQYIRHLMADPDTKEVSANVHNEHQSDTIPTKQSSETL